MTSRLVECVPNFSEGRDKTIIDRIIQPILDNEGVTLLDIDMGADFNRNGRSRERVSIGVSARRAGARSG